MDSRKFLSVKHVGLNHVTRPDSVSVSQLRGTFPPTINGNYNFSLFSNFLPSSLPPFLVEFDSFQVSTLVHFLPLSPKFGLLLISHLCVSVWLPRIQSNRAPSPHSPFSATKQKNHSFKACKFLLQLDQNLLNFCFHSFPCQIRSWMQSIATKRRTNLIKLATFCFNWIRICSISGFILFHTKHS